MVDFANILLSGKCNARCPFCIGKQIDQRLNRNMLNEYPPRNLEAFIELIQEQGIRQVVITGTNTDPQLYRHEERLLRDLREALPERTQISLHTNGRLALRKMDTINQYDRITISIPSFDEQIYHKLMGVVGVPDLYVIMKYIGAQFKISCIICDDNAGEMSSYLTKCIDLGIKRVVLRKLFGEKRSWEEILLPADRKAARDHLEMVRMILGQIGRQSYRDNPVLNIGDLQVTLWDFEKSKSTALNLFSNGLISDRYLLTEASAHPTI